ncbi:MBL fold metallo-hydrolase [Pendulispora rubella]|uniref:MBL fold metallo-hydrolase n=1 Tax=Pendulispora rubella TaxID=2741070 RepID=A0ABZ2KQ98_9BACT
MTFLRATALGFMLTLASASCHDDKIENRPPTANRLSYRVFVNDPVPFKDNERTPTGELHVFQPIASTLITGEHDAVLVDPPMTTDQSERVAQWVEASGKRLIAIATTHGHGDHWFGTSVLLRHFPDAKPYATEGTIEVMRIHADPTFRASAWESNFPGQIPDSPVVATAPSGNVFQLEGNEVRFVEVGHADTDKSSVVHVPAIGLVVAGDVVYNGYHQYLMESGNGGLRAWMSALDTVSSLKPTHVVASHKNKDLEDDPKAVEETRRYLEDVERTLPKSHNAREFYDAMIKLYPERKNPSALWWWGAKALFKDSP